MTLCSGIYTVDGQEIDRFLVDNIEVHEETGLQASLKKGQLCLLRCLVTYILLRRSGLDEHKPHIILLIEKNF